MIGKYNIPRNEKGQFIKGWKPDKEYLEMLSKRTKGNKYLLGYKQSHEHIEKRKLKLMGLKRSDEWKRKIGIANKGKIRTLEQIEKNRLWHLGKKHSEETKRKMSETHKLRIKNGLKLEGLKKYYKENSIWNKGLRGYKIHNENSKNKISIASSNFMKGFKPSKERIEKRKQTLKRKYELGIIIPSMLGKKHKEESKLLMSNSRKEYLENNPNELNRLKKLRARQILPIKDTKIEVKIQNFLEQLQIDYLKHKHMNIEHGYQCDILIPSMNLVIECDGDYWHKYPIGRDIDKVRTSELFSKGFKVLRLWENEIKVMDLNKFRDKLEKTK